MKLRSLVLPLACALAIGTAACSDRSSGGRSSGAKGEAHVAKFKIGHGIGPDGEVTGESRTFSRGEKACVSFAIADAKPESQARVSWVAKAGGAKLGEETKPLKGRDGLVNFSADTSSWENGMYSLEIWGVEPGPNGVRRLGTADFSVAAR